MLALEIELRAYYLQAFYRDRTVAPVHSMHFIINVCFVNRRMYCKTATIVQHSDWKAVECMLPFPGISYWACALLPWAEGQELCL